MNNHYVFWGIVLTLNILLTGAVTSAEVTTQDPVNRAHELNYIVVTPQGPDDGGDFGKHTPGTRTSGLQEAFNYAKEKGKDVFISGGVHAPTGDEMAIYEISETLHVPWRQNFQVNGGDYLIVHKAKQGDAVIIDSQMNCRIQFSLIVTQSNGAVVRLQPKTRGPDNFIVMVACDFNFNGLVGAGNVWGAEGERKSTGLLLDTTYGPVVSNRIFSTEFNACNTGIHFTGGPHPCSGNWFHCPDMHLCQTHIRLGDPNGTHVALNTVIATIDSQGVPDSIGAQIFGKNNQLNLTVGQSSPGNDVIFESSAQENLVTSACLPGGFTNRAKIPTNRIITHLGMGYQVETPPFPASAHPMLNRNPFPVEVMILSAGKVVQWQLTDAHGSSQTLPGPLFGGQAFRLDVAEQVSFQYLAPAVWKWRAVQ